MPVLAIFRFWRRRPIAVDFHDCLIVEHQNQAKHQMAAESQMMNQLYQDHHQILWNSSSLLQVTKRSCICCCTVCNCPSFKLPNMAMTSFFVRARCLSAGLRSWVLLADQRGIEPHRQSVSDVKNAAIPTEPRGWLTWPWPLGSALFEVSNLPKSLQLDHSACFLGIHRVHS